MPSPPAPLIPFRRKDFYELTFFCRNYAMELAHFDQGRVNLAECYRFNDWLAQVKRYDRLATALRDLKPARPVARWQIMVLMAVVWLITGLAMAGRADRTWTAAVLTGLAGMIVANFFIPEALYGTTIELLQGKVLRVVDVLLEILNSGTMDFSEAVFFRARENLLAAHAELRQQIDLAHRP